VTNTLAYCCAVKSFIILANNCHSCYQNLLIYKGLHSGRLRPFVQTWMEESVSDSHSVLRSIEIFVLPNSKLITTLKQVQTKGRCFGIRILFYGKFQYGTR
jgi:hypothetical protein